MDSDVREVIRRRIALRERDGHERLLLNHEALRALLDAADERDRLRAERDGLLAIIDDARHALSADGPKLEPARQVLARTLPAITAWQDRQRRERDNTPPHVAHHQRNQLDAVTAERDGLRAQVERVRALHSPSPAPLSWGVGAEVCASCSGDEFAPHPCDTRRALDGTEDGPTT